jgi:hypothetical protein
MAELDFMSPPPVKERFAMLQITPDCHAEPFDGTQDQLQQSICFKRLAKQKQILRLRLRMTF